MKRPAVALVLSVVALLTSSCGGGGSKQLSRTEFENQLGALLRPLQGKTLPATITISPSDPNAAVRRLKDAENAVHGAASKLASMKPPSDAVDATGRLADGVKRIADQLTSVRKAAEQGNFGQLEAFKLGIRSDPAVTEIQGAVTDLINLGYNVAGSAP